jgi:hypothetical protein
MTGRRPKGWTEAIGLRWPILPESSGQRASSPQPDQGGIVKASCRPTSVSQFSLMVVAPQSDFDRRRFASSRACANPTAPASAVADFRPSVSPAAVPSPAGAGSAAADASHVPAAPTRAPATRWRSAYTDDGRRSEFPLEPPSFAPLWWAASRPLHDLHDSTAALPSGRDPQAPTRAGRNM